MYNYRKFVRIMSWVIEDTNSLEKLHSFSLIPPSLSLLLSIPSVHKAKLYQPRYSFKEYLFTLKKMGIFLTYIVKVKIILPLNKGASNKGNSMSPRCLRVCVCVCVYLERCYGDRQLRPTRQIQTGLESGQTGLAWRANLYRIMGRNREKVTASTITR